MDVLDVGCGKHKFPAAVGIDANCNSDADVIHDLNVAPWPLDSNGFDEIRCMAIIEHIREFYPVFEEIHHIGRPGARVIISVPHCTDTAAFTDPTHVAHYNSYSFELLYKNSKWDFYTHARFRLVHMDIVLLLFWRALGFQFLVNHSEVCRKFWENYLCFIIRGKNVNLVLEVIK